MNNSLKRLQVITADNGWIHSLSILRLHIMNNIDFKQWIMNIHTERAGTCTEYSL